MSTEAAHQPRTQRRPGAPSTREEDSVLETVRRAIRHIEYGSVLIKIHQGEVVGIETSTKMRFKDLPERP
jgi:hypothetical protein